MNVYAVCWTAAVALAASSCCTGREVDGEGTIGVTPDEPCPDEAAATEIFEARGGWGGEDFVSVDGPAERTAGKSQQECCYEVALVDPPEQRRVCLSVISDAVAPQACPVGSEAAERVTAVLSGEWLDDRFGSILAGPEPGAAYPRQDLCTYPTTMSTSADSCG